MMLNNIYEVLLAREAYLNFYVQGFIGGQWHGHGASTWLNLGPSKGETEIACPRAPGEQGELCNSS